MAFRLLVTFILIALSLPALAKKKDETPKADWAFVEKKLTKAKMSQAFIKEMKRLYETKDFAATIELNTLLFLRAPNHHDLLSPDAVDRTRTFMTKNRTALDKAEKTHGVPGSVVASLLWIETKHGKDLGRFHVPSVYAHLLQADRPLMLKHLKAAGTKYKTKLTKADLKGIETRAKKRVAWAMLELKALQTMHKRNPKALAGLKGSFAGAFGYPQFIPSSYVKWARSQTKGKPADLAKPTDAIESVAFYLKDNGWKKAEKSHTKALMRYNNSDTYAAAILELASKARRDPGSRIAKRDTASEKKKAKTKKK